MALPDRVVNTEGTEIDLRSLVDTVRRMYVSDPERAEWLMDDIVSYLPRNTVPHSYLRFNLSLIWRVR